MHFISRKLKGLKDTVKKHPRLKYFLKWMRNPIVGIIGYLYGSYLTIRYVDEYNKFPAIIFRGGLIRLHIRKGFGSKLSIGDRLIVEPLSATRTPSMLQMGDEAVILIKGEFIIGDGVEIATFNAGAIYIGGKDKESGAGISANSKIIAKRKIVIGCDTIFAWDIYITDSDWHPIDGRPVQSDTIIGNHVWIAVGAKILKGSNIGDDSIVASNAVVAGGSYPAKSLLAGVPAKLVRTSIAMWHRDFN